jgi:homoserine dehydrogenase
LVLVLTLTHGIRIPFESVYVEGIRHIDNFDVKMAREFLYKIKLLAVIKSLDGRVEARLHPTMIRRNHPLARVDGVFNGIYLKGDMVGDQLFYGRGAGKEPTASAVVGDIVELARNIASGESRRVPPLGYPEDRIVNSGLMKMEDIETNYYLRVQALDRPGVLSRISGIMSEHSISIHSVIQKGRDRSGAVPIVFVTHIAREADIQKACRKIAELEVVEGPTVIIRIEDENLS